MSDVPPETPTESWRPHTERARAESFGGVARNYDRLRPGYPSELIDDVVAHGGSDVLDVGCGTGKAARLLSERGLEVLGVEVDPLMAVVAREHGVAVEVDSFELWEPAGRRFDLLVSGQAWHWIDPRIGVPKAATVLRPGGTVALFWNHAVVRGELYDQLAGVYRYRAPALAPAASSTKGARGGEPPYVTDFAASGLFEPPFTRTYRWEQSYTTQEWIDLVLTHSNHLTLDPARRDLLVTDLIDVIEANGARVIADYSTYTVFARVPSP